MALPPHWNPSEPNTGLWQEAEHVLSKPAHSARSNLSSNSMRHTKSALPPTPMAVAACQGHTHVQRTSSAGSVASRRSAVSGIGDLPSRTSFDARWQAPTREALGHPPSSRGSDVSSVRTATTIRDFFAEERRWAADSAGTRRSSMDSARGRPPRSDRARLASAVGPAAAASVLPGVPPGKIPGGRNDMLYAPRPPYSGVVR